MNSLGLLKEISSETFEEAVKENMDCFEMNVTEARKESVSQFRQQGVNVERFVLNEDNNSS